MIALQLIPPFATDAKDLDRLAGIFQLGDLAPRSAHDRAVETAAKTAIRRRHDQEMHLIPAGPGKQLRRILDVGDTGREIGQHVGHAFRERPSRLGLLLRLFQLGRRHQLHGAGDLLRLLDAADPASEFF